MMNRNATDRAINLWFWAKTVCFRGLRGALIWSIIGCVIGFEVALALSSTGPSIIAQMIIQGILFGIIGLAMGIVFDSPIATIVGASTGLFVGLIGTKLLPEFAPYKTQLVCLLMGSIFGTSFMSYMWVLKRFALFIYKVYQRTTGRYAPSTHEESEDSAPQLNMVRPSAVGESRTKSRRNPKIEKSA